MADTISLEIVTPDGLKLKEQVNELTAPSVQGEFGVLPQHRPMLAALATGATFVASIFTPWAVVIGAVPVAIALTLWFWPKTPPSTEPVVE